MNDQELQKYKRMLLELREEIQSEISDPDEEATPVPVDTAMGRISRGDAMQVQQMALEMKRRREERLIRIETALVRIEKRAYGHCGRCRKPIDETRLSAFPEVVLCVRCAS